MKCVGLHPSTKGTNEVVSNLQFAENIWRSAIPPGALYFIIQSPVAKSVFTSATTAKLSVMCREISKKPLSLCHPLELPKLCLGVGGFDDKSCTVRNIFFVAIHDDMTVQKLWRKHA